MLLPVSGHRKCARGIVAGAALFAVTVALVFDVRSVRAQTEAPSIATVTELMQAMIIPASNRIFDVPRHPPGDDEGWTAVRNSAVILAESGTLLLRQGRAKDSETWITTSQALSAAGEAALVAARSRDVDGVSDAGNLLIDSCERCHEEHWIR